MIRTYLDSGALIGSVRGKPETVQAVSNLIVDPGREFVSSVFVRLEILPKAVHHRRTVEVGFYRWFFDRVVDWVKVDDALLATAESEALRLGLSALDALHVAAAVALGADELVTTERPTKPIHRATAVAVVGL